MAITIGELVGKIEWDTRGLDAGLKRVQTAVGQADATFRKMEAPVARAEQAIARTATTASRMAPAMNTARSVAGQLAAQAAGLSGSLGSVAGAFGSLAVGSAATAGILGGMAVVTAGVLKLTEGFRESKKATDDAIDSFVKAARLRALGPAGATGESVELSKAKRDSLQERLTAAENSVGPEGMRDEGGILQLRKQLAAAETAVIEGERQLWEGSRELWKARNEVRDGLEKEARLLDIGNSEFAKLFHAAAQTAEAVIAMTDKALAGLSHDGRRHRSVGSSNLGTFGSSAALSEAEAARAATKAEWKRRNTLLPFGESLTAQSKAPDMGVLAQGDTQGRAGAAIDAFAAGAQEAGDILKGSFGPASLGLAAVFEVFRGIMEPLQPILDVVSGLLQSFGNVLGSLLLPVLKPVIVVFSYVAEAIGTFIRALGKVIDALPLVSAKSMIRAGEQMVKDAKAARQGLNGTTEETENLGAAAEKTAEALANVPSGYKIALERFHATSPENMGGGGTVAGATGGLAGILQSFAPGAVVIQGSHLSPDQLYDRFLQRMESEASRGGVNYLALAAQRVP